MPTAAFDGVTQQARVRFEQGLAAYQEGRYRAAVEHFKEADRLAPSARLSYNIALAFERMSDTPMRWQLIATTCGARRTRRTARRPA